MKKITPFRVTAYTIIILVAAFCELVVQREALSRRGYMTIGGEILVFPAVIYLCSLIFESIMARINEDDTEENDQE